MSRIFCFISILLLSVQFIFAQQDTLKGIVPIISILGERSLSANNGLFSIEIDSTLKQKYQNQNLADVLANETPIYIKMYAPGQLASVSMRGGSASHTALLWNGLNVNSATLGMSDLSIFPMDMSDYVKVDFGTQAPLWGSGAISGSIHIATQPIFNQGLKVLLNNSVGSFSNYRNSLTTIWSSKNFFSRTRIGRFSALNDFKFPNRANNNNIQNQVNSDILTHYLTQDFHFQSARNIKIGLNLWAMQSDRGIAPTMISLNNNQRQEDRNLRLNLFAEQALGKFSWRIRQALLIDEMQYLDTISAIHSLTQTQTWVSEFEASYSLNKRFSIWSALNYTQANAQGSGLLEDVQQHRIAWVNSVNYKSKNQKLKSVMSIRAEKVTLVNVPLLPSWSVDWQITQEVRLYSNIAKHYRLPTFNDLYWANGGNPNLKPENGYSVDLGVEPHLKKGNYSVSANLNAFYRNVNNWIQWIPTGNFWMPENVMNVDSRGGEFFLKANYQSKSYSLSFQSFYSYTASENTLIGRQLIYVPFEKVGGNLSFTYSKYQLRYNHQFTGFTFISTDNSSWLPSFQTGDLFLGTQFIFKSLTIQPNLGVHNIWNHNYEVILYRPMPGRFYQLSFNFIFNNPNKIKL